MSPRAANLPSNIAIEDVIKLMDDLKICDQSPENFYEDTRHFMWQYQAKKTFGLCAMCDVCGGSSVSFCDCAYKLFLPSIKEMTKYHNESLDELVTRMV